MAAPLPLHVPRDLTIIAIAAAQPISAAAAAVPHLRPQPATLVESLGFVALPKANCRWDAPYIETHPCEGRRIGPQTGSKTIQFPETSGINVLYPHVEVFRSSRNLFHGASCLRSYSAPFMCAAHWGWAGVRPGCRCSPLRRAPLHRTAYRTAVARPGRGAPRTGPIEAPAQEPVPWPHSTRTNPANRHMYKRPSASPP